MSVAQYKILHVEPVLSFRFLIHRVLELEKKKESTHLGSRKRIQPDATSKMEESESDDDAEDGNDIDEYLDWRAKKAHK